jgi:uncharacterized protein (DUF1800 family)
MQRLSLADALTNRSISYTPPPSFLQNVNEAYFHDARRGEYKYNIAAVMRRILPLYVLMLILMSMNCTHLS